MSSSLLFSVVFSNVNPNSTRKEILLYLVSFYPLKSKVSSFLTREAHARVNVSCGQMCRSIDWL